MKKLSKQNGQALLGLAVIVSIASTFVTMIYRDAAVRSFAQNIRHSEMSIVRSAFEKAAKNLRYIYQTQASCNPQLFARAVASLPNPPGVGADPAFTKLCNSATLVAAGVEASTSCRALEISSSLEVQEASGGRLSVPLYVFIGFVSFSRVDPPCADPPSSGCRVNDFRASSEASDGVPNSVAGVHLRTVYNNTKYEQWVVLLDTCSSMRAPEVTGAAAKEFGVGLGTSWQLGSTYSPLGGVSTDTVSCVGALPMGRMDAAADPFVDFQNFKQIMSFIPSRADFGPEDFPNPQCMDLNQDGVTDERDLNILEKYWLGWIPSIPVRWR